MGHALTRCAKCGRRHYEAEVRYSPEHKDYICRDSVKCEKPLTNSDKYYQKKLTR